MQKKDTAAKKKKNLYFFVTCAFSVSIFLNWERYNRDVYMSTFPSATP